MADKLQQNGWVLRSNSKLILVKIKTSLEIALQIPLD